MVVAQQILFREELKDEELEQYKNKGEQSQDNRMKNQQIEQEIDIEP